MPVKQADGSVKWEKQTKMVMLDFGQQKPQDSIVHYSTNYSDSPDYAQKKAKILKEATKAQDRLSFCMDTATAYPDGDNFGARASKRLMNDMSQVDENIPLMLDLVNIRFAGADNV